MKKLLLMAFMLCGIGMSAQVREIRNSLGHIIAFECSGGTIKNVNVQPQLVISDTLGSIDTLVFEDLEILNINATVLFSVDDSLVIRNGVGLAVAYYDTLANAVTDINEELVFKISASGTVSDELERTMGVIDSEGNVYGSDGNFIAVGPSIDRFKLAYLFFTEK